MESVAQHSIRGKIVKHALSLKRDNLAGTDGAFAIQEMQCFGCEAIFSTSELSRCSNCRLVRYCSKECQRKHWREGGHKDECAFYRTARKAAGDTSRLPDDPGERASARLLIGAKYLERGDFVAAEQEFRAIIEVENARMVGMHHMLASAIMAQNDSNRLDEVLEIERIALASPPGGPFPEDLTELEVWRTIGRALEMQKDVDGAKEAYREVLTRDSNHSETKIRLKVLEEQ